MTTKLDKMFESKTFEQTVNVVLLGMWTISGIAGFYIIPGTTQHLQWVYGVVFGLFLLKVTTAIVTKSFWMLYNNISAFRSYVDKHYGDQ